MNAFKDINKVLESIHESGAFLTNSVFVYVCDCAVQLTAPLNRSVWKHCPLFAAVRGKEPDNGRGYVRDYRQNIRTVRYM